MELFEKYYGTYRFMLSLVGLWPYNKSIYRTIQRILFFGFLMSCLVVEVVSLLKSEITLQHFIHMLSSVFPGIIVVLRYIFFIADFPVVKYLFEHVRMEESLLEDSNEIQILKRYFEFSSYVIYAFLWTGSVGFVFLATLLLAPIELDLLKPLKESRTRHIRYVLEPFTERNFYMDIISLQFVVADAIGLLSLVCTEAALTIFSHYSCGLFKIASYRIQNAIKNMTASAKQIELNNRGFSRAVDIHRRAIRYVNLVSSRMMVTYMIITPLTVISFAINLHRMSRAIVSMNDGKEISSCITLVVVHLMFILLNNYSGQILIDDSLDVCIVSYSSIWYEIPLEAQKLLAFIMLRSSVECSFNISGLFVPCYRGLSAMLSTSFSYFTLMFSIQ